RGAADVARRNPSIAATVSPAASSASASSYSAGASRGKLVCAVSPAGHARSTNEPIPAPSNPTFANDGGRRATARDAALDQDSRSTITRHLRWRGAPAHGRRVPDTATWRPGAVLIGLLDKL